MDALLDRVDVDRLVGRTSIGGIVTDSATTVATSVLDLVRGQLAALDSLAGGVVRGVLRRRGPTPSEQENALAGAPAGAFSRLAAYAIDATVVTALFGFGVVLMTYIANLVVSNNFDPTRRGGPWWAAIGIAFAALYFWSSIALVGRTIGKALLGLRVVRVDGGFVGGRAALVRAVTFPLGFVLGLGFVPILVRKDRRALHDLIAHTMVVYDWGARTAAYPQPFARWLERRRSVRPRS